MTQGQIEPLNEGRLDFSAQPQSLERRFQVRALTAQHLGVDLLQLVADLQLTKLAVEQPGQHVPHRLAMAFFLHPYSKMGRESIEVLLKPIAGEHRHAVRG